MCAKVSDELSLLQIANINSIKRALQWVLGCTYVKKSIKSRLAEMFQFNEAPHIIIYEKSDSDTWLSKIGIVIGVLIFVLIAYYLVESMIRSIRSFLKAALKEPQSTVSTPRCLSPNASKTMLKLDSPEKQKGPEQKECVTLVKQKIKMNEPVNCVFIRPQTPQSPQIKSDVTQSSDNIASNPKSKQLEKSEGLKPARSEEKLRETRGESGSENVNDIEEMWMESRQEQREEVEVDRKSETDSESYCDISSEILNEIKKMLNAPNLTKNSTIDEDFSSSLQSIESSSGESNWTDRYCLEMDQKSQIETEKVEGIGKETIADYEEADIVIDDNHLFAEEENWCSGNILVKDLSKVLFRWTDDNPSSVDAVTISGSFFGWNMHLPMRRHPNGRTFEVCIELPPGMHSYQIQIFRFD